MVKKCCVHACLSESYGGCNISFHSFPKIEEMRQKWLESLHVKQKVTKNSVVCSRHFEPSSFYTANSRQMLKTNAIPTMCLVTKRENAITAGAPGSIKFDKVDLKILDVIEQEPPFLDVTVKEKVPETGNDTQEPIKQVVPHFADVQNIPQTSNAGNETTIRNIRPPKRKLLKSDTNEYLYQKKKLTLELLSHDIYLRKLQALKLEKELGLNRSEYTQDLEGIQCIKTENTSEMEFEY